jgi:hypothetical protein
VQEVDLFIPLQENLVNEPANGQNYRWRFTRQAATPNEEESSIVIEIPVAHALEALYFPEEVNRNQTNGYFAQYFGGGKIPAYAFSAYEDGVTAQTGTVYGAGAIAWTYTSSDPVKTVTIQTINLSTASEDGAYILHEPLMTMENTYATKALTFDSNGATIPAMDSDQRDSLPLDKMHRLIFNTDTGKLNFHNGTVWREIHDNPI